MNDLEKRIQTLEDIESIKKLRSMYSYLVDAGIAGDETKYDELASHFVDEGWLDYGPFGVHRGKEAIVGFFKEAVNTIFSYGSHMNMNSIIEVDGDQATGKWYVLAPGITRSGNRATITHGKYDEVYVKVRGEWKWKSIIFTADFLTPLDEGWAKTPFISS